MRKHLLLGAAALIAAPLALSTAAHATLISIGLQEVGYNSNNITTVATDSGTGAVSVAGLNYGTFVANNISALGSPLQPQPILDTTSVQISSSVAGTIKVFVTAQGLSSPQGIQSFLSSFTAQPFLGASLSVVEKTFVDATNGIYGGSNLANSTFGAAGGTASIAALTPNLNGLYSETVEYIITVGAGFSNVNDTINISAVPAVPEPMSLALLGSSLVGLGLVRRRG